MKRFVAILLVLLLALSLAACGQKSAGQNASIQTPAPTLAPQATVEPTPTPVPTPTPIPADLLPVIKILDERSPEQLVQGRKFGVRGIVYTEKGVLTEVFAKVNDAGGNTVLSSNVYKPNEARIDLHSSVNNDLSFGKLEAGTYTYIVTASANNNGAIVKTDVVNRVFTVSTEGNAQVAAGTTESPVSNPGALASYAGSYKIFAPEGMAGTLELRQEGDSCPFTLNVQNLARIEGSASLGAAYQAVLDGKDVNGGAIKAELVNNDNNTWKLLVTESELSLLPSGTELLLARGVEAGSVVGNVVDYYVGKYNSPDGAATLELKKEGESYPFALSIVNLTRIEGSASNGADSKTLLEGKDANGNPIKAELGYAGDGEYTLTFTDSQWNLLPNGTELRFVNPDAPNGPDIPVVPQTAEEPAEEPEAEQPAPQTPAPTVKPAPQKSEKSAPSVGLIALIIVLLLAAAAAGYFFYKKKAVPMEEETYQGRH